MVQSSLYFLVIKIDIVNKHIANNGSFVRLGRSVVFLIKRRLQVVNYCQFWPVG